MNAKKCSIGSGDYFQLHPALWQQLNANWQLSPDEAEYLDRQQGKCCTSCGGYIYSNALSNSLKSILAKYRPFPTAQISKTPQISFLKKTFLQYVNLLEINKSSIFVTLCFVIRRIDRNRYNSNISPSSVNAEDDFENTDFCVVFRGYPINSKFTQVSIDLVNFKYRPTFFKIN